MTKILRKKLYLIGFVLGMSFFASTSFVLAKTSRADTESLASYIQRVLKDHPQWRAAKEQLEATKEDYNQALAGWRPSIYAQSSAFATDIRNSNFNNANGALTRDVTLNIEQPLYNGGQTPAELKRAKYRINIAYYTFQKIQQNILYDLIKLNAFIEKEQRVISLLSQNEELLKSDLLSAKERLLYGEGVVTDIHEVEIKMAAAATKKHAALTRLKNTHQEYEETFGDLPYITFNFERLKSPTSDYIKLKNSLTTNNLDILIAQNKLDEAEKTVLAKRALLYPSINAYARYNKQFDPQPGIIDNTQVSTVGVNASIPIYNGGLDRARIRQSVKRSISEKYNAADILRVISIDLSRIFNARENTHVRIRNVQDEIHATHAVLDGFEQQFHAGIRPFTDVLNTQTALVNAHIKLENSTYDALIHTLDLMKLGTHLTPDIIN